MNEHSRQATIAFVIGLTLVLVILTMAITIATMHGNDSRTERLRYVACKTIRNETLRRDCISGPKLMNNGEVSYAK